MKKSFFYIMAAVAAIAAVSCNKIESENTSKLMTITATFDSDTRTTPSSEGGTTYALWSTGDQITVFDEDEVSATFTLSAGAGEKKGTFTQDAGTSELKEGTLYAIYGGTNLDFDGSKISFDIPTQDGSFAKANICTASSSNGSFTFSPATAIVKVVGSSDLNYFSISTGGKDFYTMGTKYTNQNKWNDISSKISVLSNQYFIALSAGNYSFNAEKYVSDGKQNPKVTVKNFNRSAKDIIKGKIYIVTPSF